MPTSKDTTAKAIDDEQTGDEIARAVRMAMLAFDGPSLSDGHLDELCKAFLFREAKRKQKQDATKASG